MIGINMIIFMIQVMKMTHFDGNIAFYCDTMSVGTIDE